LPQKAISFCPKVGSMESIGNFFWKLNYGVIKICGWFIGIAALLASVNAILRFTRGSGFAFSDELCVYFIALFVFMALGYLDFTDEHLTIDFLSVIVKNRIAAKAIVYIRGLITLFFEGILIYYGTNVTKAAYVRHSTTAVLHIPRYYIYGIVTTSLAISFLSWLIILICKKGEFVENAN
jgi:TRAP-type C4-dicarboxylate transport system permease small subunit